jgi:hypothetical protein
MHAASQTSRWCIPGVGVLWPCIDHVIIVLSEPVGALKTHLPIAVLEKASHSFTVVTYSGPDPRLRSSIVVVGAETADPWSVLARHEHALGRYRVTQVEVACDVVANAIDAARAKLFALVGQLGKRRHQRGHVWSVHKPEQTPPAGCVSEPTFYLEDRRSSVTLKCYVRQQKLPGGGFGELILRLEWTLAGKPALTRHLGGNEIKHLLTADLHAFLKRNIRLERVDHVALGNLLRGIKIARTPGRSIPLTRGKTASLREQWSDPNYRAERAAFLVLRCLAYRERDRFASWEQALWTCQNSPAQIRGYCRELRDGKRPVRRGRPKHKAQAKRAVTDYRINACFHTIELTGATEAV